MPLLLSHLIQDTIKKILLWLINQVLTEVYFIQHSFHRTYKTDAKKKVASGEEELICRPDSEDTVKMKPGSYDKLNKYGFIPKDTKVDGGDIIIGKKLL